MEEYENIEGSIKNIGQTDITSRLSPTVEENRSLTNIHNESQKENSFPNLSNKSCDASITRLEEICSSSINLEVSDRSTLNSSDVIILEENELTINGKQEKRLSADSDIHILDETPEKTQGDSINSINSKSFNDSVQIISPDENSDTNTSENNAHISNRKFLKNVTNESSELVSPVFLDERKLTERIDFDIHPTYSTPNEVINCLNNEEKEDLQSLGDSTQSLNSFPPIQKKFSICVDVTASIYLNKEEWSAELKSISCDKLIEHTVSRLSDGSGNLADISKSTSPSSTTSLTLLPLKPSNRFSISSSSSGMTSASDLTRKILEHKFINFNKRDNYKLTEERINELKEKWINSNEIYKILDFLDKIALSTEGYVNEGLIGPKENEPLKEVLAKIEEIVTPLSTNKMSKTRGKRQPKVKFSDSENDIPTKRQRRTESPDILLNVNNFSRGDSVFAKWSDRKFYAAILGDTTVDGKWEVNFFDGDKKTMSEDLFIKAEEFTLVGHNVYASQGDDNFTPGIITGCELNDGVLHYKVARDKGDVSVPCQFIFITESQARAIRGKTTPHQRTPSKTNENLLLPSGNQRSTRSKTRLLYDSPKPSSSGTQKAVLSDSDDEDNKDSEINFEEVAGIEPESHGVYENGIKLKGKTLTGKMRFARTKDNDANATVLGPIPEEGSKFFSNFHVLLTCTRSLSPRIQAFDGNSSEGLSSENENYTFSTIPFVKDRLKLQLKMGGACIYNNLDEIPSKLRKSTYLISNRPNNSAIYIQCLAAGIKIVCHEWVIRCCKEKKKFPLQELPLGWSIEFERFIKWTDRKFTAALKNLNLLIIDTGDNNFFKFWSKVCHLANISVDKLTRDSNLKNISAIISESGYPDDRLERAILHDIPLVTTTWLIQSILHGEPRQFKGHKAYMIDNTESE